MLNRGLNSRNKPLKTAKLSFRIPYFTQWGQSILVSGSEPVLGSWNVKQGLVLKPFHQGDQLIWSGRITVPIGFKCEYSYYLVDADRNVLRWEEGKKRMLILPEGIQEGEVLELRDLWQTASEALFLRSAFKDVIFHGAWSQDLETHPEKFIMNQQDAIIVQFKISCPRIRDDTLVYVTGNSVQLGQWKAQDGLKLHYVGESIWQAQCLLQTYEFPIRYKYCQIGKGETISLEVGPNRELVVDSPSEIQPRYLSLSDGMFRVRDRSFSI